MSLRHSKQLVHNLIFIFVTFSAILWLNLDEMVLVGEGNGYAKKKHFFVHYLVRLYGFQLGYEDLSTCSPAVFHSFQPKPDPCNNQNSPLIDLLQLKFSTPDS